MRKYKPGLRRNLQAVFPDTAPNSMPPRGEARCPLPQAAPTQAHQPVSRKAAAHRGTVRKHAQKPFGIVHPPAFQAAPYTFPIRVFRFRCVRSCKCCIRFSKATRRLSEALQPPFRGNSPVHPGRRSKSCFRPLKRTQRAFLLRVLLIYSFCRFRNNPSDRSALRKVPTECAPHVHRICPAAELSAPGLQNLRCTAAARRLQCFRIFRRNLQACCQCRHSADIYAPLK